MFDFIERIKNVPNENKAIVFWSWNDVLDKDVLIKQIDDLYNSGFGGFVIHARSGLKTEYLGKEWFDCVDACIERAEQLSMNVWFYDENGWPSGFCGGKLLDNDDYLISGIKYYESEVWNDEADAVYIRKNNKVVRVFEPQDNSRYIIVKAYKRRSYVDLCNENVCKAFIASTHELYYERYADKFGKTVKGFFTDEPQYLICDNPFSYTLAKVYKDRYNEDIFDKIALLFYDGEGQELFRYRYWSLFNELICNNYFKQLYLWCEQHNCKLTGHGIDERNFVGQMQCSAGVMPFYQYMQLPGIDFLGRYNTAIRIAKQVSSVAKQFNRRQVLTETFACTGWDTTFNEFKNIINPQFIGGANLVCYHLYPYSFRGQRRFDCPCNFSSCDPWWSEFKYFNEYINRLSNLVFLSTEKCKVAVLNTLRSCYPVWKKSEAADSVFAYERSMSDITEVLLSFGVQFDYIDEEILKTKGKVSDGKLTVGNCEYDTIIAPKFGTLEETTYDMLIDCVKNGVKFVNSENSVCNIDGDASEMYLGSTASIDDVIAEKAILSVPSKNILVSDRKIDDHELVLIANNDGEHSSSAHIKCEKSDCAGRLDLESFTLYDVEVKNGFIDVELKPAETAAIIFDLKCGAKKSKKCNEVLSLKPDFIYPAKNYYTVNKLKYSLDGINYSDETMVFLAFKELLKKHYEGQVYLKYSFVSKNMSNGIFAELDIIPDEIIFNGTRMDFDVVGNKVSFRLENIIDGENNVILQVDFYQRQYVYDVLEGKYTTESLLNCLYYDTEFSELYLEGDFSILSSGTTKLPDSYCCERPFVMSGVKPDKYSNLCDAGLPFYRGALNYRFNAECTEGKYILQIKGRFAVGRISVNGREGKIFIGNEVSIDTENGINSIDIEVISGNRNAYGPFMNRIEDVCVFSDAFTGDCLSEKGAEIIFDKDKYYFVPFGIERVKMFSSK